MANANRNITGNATVLSKLKTLKDEEYRTTLVESFDRDREFDVLRKVSNAWLDRIRKASKRRAAAADDEAAELQGTVTSSSSSPAHCSSVSTAAWMSPMIFRGDKIPSNGFIFVDMEKISMQTLETELAHGKKAKHQQAAATVAVVNEKNDLIFWAFVKREKVCQYFPSITRLDKSKLTDGMEIGIVQTLFNLCGKQNTVVGLNVANDILSLGLDPAAFKICDLQYYFRDGSGPYSARSLAHGLMKMEKFQCESHSAISDARFTRDLFFKKRELEAAGHLVCPIIPRVKATKFVNDKNDKCKCKRNPYN